MPLSDYEIPYEDVALPRGQTFKVRGLSLSNITYLVQNHLGDLTKAVDLYLQKKNGRVAKSSLSEFAMVIARDLPLLTTEIISVATDEENVASKVARLPILVQINALLSVCKLTTEEAGGLKNLSAFVAPLLGGVAAAEGSEPGTLKRRLLDFIGASGLMSASLPPVE